MAAIPVFLPGKLHGQRSLAGYSPWGQRRVGHKRVTKQQQLIYNVVLVSGAQQSDSFIHIFILIQISIFFHIG